ncbi:hypothetical protein CS542_04750 [Pedobacter sp. IW39]|nr:hypothetical protein CS542_04750 [Pedobacter sp. IW39]
MRKIDVFTFLKLNENLINWQPEKTIKTYIRKLHQSKQAQFLHPQFEYIWYGEFFSQENFKQAK